MKKLSIILLTAVLALSLTACGEPPATEPSEASTVSQASVESTSSNSENSSDETSSNTSSKPQESSETTSETSEPSTSDNSSEASKSDTSESSDVSNPSSSKPSDTSNPNSSKPSDTSSPSSSKPSDTSTPSSSEPSDTSNPESIKIGPLMQACCLDITNSGKFYMDATLNGQANGQLFKNASFIMAVDQENNKAYLATKSVINISDGTDSYKLYPLLKSGIKISSYTPDMTLDKYFNIDDIFLVDTGSETFNGKKCQYEAYYADGTTMTAYFYNNALIGMVIQSDENDKSASDYTNLVVIINELSTDVDESLFTVPSDYKITESDSSSLL